MAVISSQSGCPRRLETAIKRFYSVVINEFMTVNGDSLQTKVRRTAEAEFSCGLVAPDWIELSNVMGVPLGVGGIFYMNDNPNNLQKWWIPGDTVIQPSVHLLLFASSLIV